MKIGDVVVDDFTHISEHLIGYYSSFLSDLDAHLPNLSIPSLVTVEDNNSLIKVPDHNEIRQTIFEMVPMSALGPDGFIGSSLDIVGMVGSDVVDVVQYVYPTDTISLGLNSDIISLGLFCRI